MTTTDADGGNAEPAHFAQPATDGFYAGFDPDPALPKRLAALAAPMLLVTGEYDIWPTSTAVRALAALLARADLALLAWCGSACVRCPRRGWPSRWSSRSRRCRSRSAMKAGTTRRSIRSTRSAWPWPGR